jgi:hypothetical protein
MSRSRREDGFRVDRRLTRRDVLAAVALGGLASALPARAEEPTKVSQAAAAYQGSPKDSLSCAVCTFFIHPRSCKVVSGEISPTGWCKLFDLSD